MTFVRACVRLARPRLLPGVLALPVLGFGWAHWDRALALRAPGALAEVLVAWTALHAGTLWLNAALDRDEGEVLLGEPVSPPAGLTGAGLVALGIAVAVGAAVSAPVGWATSIAAVLAVAYSHPALAWKGHPWLGPATNVVGYGILSPWVGWSVVGVAPDARTAVVGAGLALGILGCFFVAQAFQEAEDRARGYRTLVATHGPGVTIAAARAALGGGLLVLVALVVVGWLPRLLLLALPGAWGVDAALRRWAAGPVGVAGAVDVGRRLVRLAALLVGLATVDHAVAHLWGGPVAGLATADGWPRDVERIPAWARRPPQRPPSVPRPG